MKIQMSSLVLFFAIFCAASALNADCVPPVERISYNQPSAGGHYYRFDPTGRWALVSFEGSSQILDLNGKDASGKRTVTVMSTPMKDETYPVEGGDEWRLISSPLHDDGMRYYDFQDFVGEGRGDRAKVISRVLPVYRDKELNNWYQSSAQLPGSNASVTKVRTCLYDEVKCRDYDFNTGPGGEVTTVNPGPITTHCTTIVDPNEPTVPKKIDKAAEETRERRRQEYLALRARIRASLEESNTANEVRRNELRNEVFNILFIRLREYPEFTRGRSDTSIANPVLSKDGTRVAGLLSGTIQVFKIKADGICERIVDTKYRGSKVSFSYPESGREPKITFSVEGGPSNGFDRQAVIFDLNSGTTQSISSADEDAYYPGFTKDGRVIFRGKGSGNGTTSGEDNSAAMVIVDPNQMTGGSGKCIERREPVSGGNRASPASPPTFRRRDG